MIQVLRHEFRYSDWSKITISDSDRNGADRRYYWCREFKSSSRFCYDAHGSSQMMHCSYYIEDEEVAILFKLKFI